MITTLKAPYTPWNHMMNMFFSTPSDYEQNTKELYPVILFFHGKGEIGTDINKVLSMYLPKLAANGDIVGVTPEGVSKKFIIIGGQDQYWSPYPPNFRTALKYVVDTYKLRVDPNRIYVTGLSAGGQTSLMYGCLDDTFIGKVTAIASLSPSEIEQKAFDNLPKLGNAKTPVLFWSGSTDGMTDNAKEYTTIINNNKGNAKTVVFSGGHCCWDYVYTKKVKFKSVDGTKDLNLYDWFLQFSLDTTVEPEPPTVPEKKYIFTATLDKLPEAYPVSITLSDGTKIDIKLTIQ